jgi:hypothetical protein
LCLAAAVAGAAHLPERAFERFDLAFVVDFLSLGEFEGFQDQFHFVERVFQFFDDLVDLFDGAGDGRDFFTGLNFPGWSWCVFGFFSFDFGWRSAGLIGWCGGGRRRRARAAATSRVASATASVEGGAGGRGLPRRREWRRPPRRERRGPRAEGTGAGSAGACGSSSGTIFASKLPGSPGNAMELSRLLMVD